MIVCLSVATPCQKMRVLSKFFMTFVSDRTHKLQALFALVLSIDGLKTGHLEFY